MKDIDILPTPIVNEVSRRGKPLIITTGSFFKGLNMTRAMITDLFLDSVRVAVVYVIL